jgi:PAS domain S-box-containing protein
LTRHADPTRPRVGSRQRDRDAPTTVDAEFRLLFESAPGLILVLRPDLTMIAVSDAYLRATMTEREAIIGRGLFEVFPDNPDDPDASGTRNLRASLERVRNGLVADTMAVQKYDIRRPEAEGGGFEERYWSPLNLPVLGPDGTLRYIIHRVEDVTDFVRLQAKAEGSEIEVIARAREIAEANRRLGAINADLRRSEAFLDSIIENIPAMVFVKDARSLRFVRFNRAGEELLGQDRADLIGRSDRDLVPGLQAAAFVAKDQEVFAGRAVVDVAEEAITTVHHGTRILHTRKFPVFDDAGQPMYLVGISQDITDRKAAEDDLRAARETADAANLAKSEFLSRMSHELRTPLNAILGFAQLLEMDPLEPSQLASVEHISRAGRHLLDLINEVLDISRIESGQLAVSLEPVSVAELVVELVDMIGPLASAGEIDIDALDVASPGFLLADRQRLKQVLLNLLSNAVKYNRQGGSVHICSTTSAAGRVRLSVEDTGFGIAPELVPRLFRPFDRLGAETGPIDGTGMGLALSKGLVEAMGGTIGVASQPGAGSTFWVELASAESPIEGLADLLPARMPSDRLDRPRRRILQIEDNSSNIRLVEEVVSRQSGLEAIVAHDGFSGIELALREGPDLILLDLHLPDIPGGDVLKRLKAHPQTAAIPVIVITADATKTQERALLSDGAVAYLTKPIDLRLLLQTIDRSLGVE